MIHEHEPRYRPVVSSLKDYKLAEKRAAEQVQVVSELEELVKDIERCEKTISDLKADLLAVNEKHKERKSTREDVAYLEDLLKCAKRKLAWEKQMESLQKRTPEILQRMSAMIEDPKLPPEAPVRAAMLRSLQSVQAAMERLDQVKVK
ncbi:MAG TPA: hypothetical protein VK530_14790 [Candidatus Acidoferrum sp.]|nr:hypothetical protein [Candidatus Acidoferrum sp.]